ncbi:MAG: hypothetical protein JJT81_17155, partial [Rubellimicrobium sp.]|nr:hypothetical protein [Rubellimicrobium sp.]
ATGQDKGPMAAEMDEDFHDQVLSAIYDCAVDPAGWGAALTMIRDRLDLSYLLLHFFRFPPGYPDVPQEGMVVGTEWDRDWLNRLEPLLPSVPHFDRMRRTPIDRPATQLQFLPEEEFRQTEFYRVWVAPQRLRYNCLVNVVARENMVAMLSGASGEERGVISERDTALLAKLSPHVRRALMISDLLDETRSQQMMQARLLDGLRVALFLVGERGHISYANTAGEEMLSAGELATGKGGRLGSPARVGGPALAASITRACTGSDADIGVWGNGIPLMVDGGDPGVAYVLPLGRSDKRHALGNGMAAVAITTRDDACPPETEVLMALTGLTAAEVRVALAVAAGRSLDSVAADNDVTTETVRRHLKNAYDKTGARSQPALGAYVNALRVPLTLRTG